MFFIVCCEDFCPSPLGFCLTDGCDLLIEPPPGPFEAVLLLSLRVHKVVVDFLCNRGRQDGLETDLVHAVAIVLVLPELPLLGALLPEELP